MDLDGLEEANVVDKVDTYDDKTKDRELRVPQDEIWGVGRFGGLNPGIVSERSITSKSGKYVLHGIKEGPNKGNWLVSENYDNGTYKNLYIAGPKAFKDVYSENFSERGRSLTILENAQMLGANPTGTFRNNLKSAMFQAWSPENIVMNLSLGITSLEKLSLLIENNAAKEVSKGTNVVYQGFDKAGVVRYVGITERQAAVRFGEHISSGTAKSLLRYEVVPGATNLTRTGARVWEQGLINQYGLGKNGGLLFNRINSISPSKWYIHGIK